MYIYVDESGTFTANAKVPTDSWCVVVAYASPESDLERLDALVSSLRAERGGGVEVKLHQVGEARYVRFLRDLSRLNGLMFAVSVDVSLHSLDGVQAHQLAQADKVIENREKMIHATVREQLTVLRGEILDLPAQLYTQLICQIELFHKVLQRAPLYFSQHKPETLASFKWRIDQKDTIPTTYETAFRTILPSLLQTKSFRDPMVSLIEGNNEYLKRFEFPEGQYPTYLDEHYGVKSKGQGLNVGQMAQEDFQLVDSSAVSGVQAADLLASGLRKLFRGEFNRQHEIALLLGANMVGELTQAPIVRLISLSRTMPVSDRTAHILELMKKNAKPLLRP